MGFIMPYLDMHITSSTSFPSTFLFPPLLPPPDLIALIYSGGFLNSYKSFPQDTLGDP